jgi:hypothetical protein
MTNKTLVLYVFHQINSRVEHFLKNAIFEDDNVNFIIISNDKNNKLNVPSYVMTFYRDNIGFDFGGWSDALLTNDLYKKYNRFIFVNSSVIGPFLETNTIKWTDIYLNGLTNNIKLFGSTINTCMNPNKSHVQSYIFSMDIETLNYLIQCEIFSTQNIAKTFYEAVYNKEVLMSRKIIENNWNIGSLLNHYKNVDFRNLNKLNVNLLDDIMFPRWLNVLWKPNQLVFIKGNRFGIK